MKINKFILNIIIRALLLFAFIFVFIWSVFQEHLIIAKFTFLVLALLSLISLIQYVTQTNRQLSIFLESLAYSDTIIKSKKNDPSFKRLDLSFSQIKDIVMQAQLEKEAEHQYFEYTIEHADVGLMSVKSDGKIEFVNQAGKELLGLEKVERLEDLEKIEKGMCNALKELKYGHKQVFNIIKNGDLLKLSFAVKDVKIKSEAVRIYSFQNIRTELEYEELEAWQKLIKVLRHEIMNSITPVKSLSYSILKGFDKIRKNGYVIDDKEQMDKVFEGMHAIHSRSVGMMNFIESYREITKVMTPAISNVGLSSLLNDVVQLFGEEVREKDIKIAVSCHQDITMDIDEKLISQVLINLIKNAIEAKDSDKSLRINIKVYQTDTNTEIVVSDNGNGIPEDVLSEIFVPFFTTKEQGSGIGLSLSREIMRKHNGSINIKSEEGQGTTVSLLF